MLGAVALASEKYLQARDLCEESLATFPEEPYFLSTRVCLGLATRRRRDTGADPK